MYNKKDLEEYLNENLLEAGIEYNQVYEIGYNVSQNRFNSFILRTDISVEDINKVISATKLWKWKMMEYNPERIESSNVNTILDKVVDNHGNVFIITEW